MSLTVRASSFEQRCRGQESPFLFKLAPKGDDVVEFTRNGRNENAVSNEVRGTVSTEAGSNESTTFPEVRNIVILFASS